MTPAIAFSWACAGAVAGLVAADRRGQALARALCKMVASSAFVAVALALGATRSAYGQFVLAALLLGWLGDALLLSRRDALFLSGLGAFLLSHVGYLFGFASGGLSAAATAAGALAVTAAGAAVLRWLWPHLQPGFKPPVLAYVLTIAAMCAAAAGHAASSGRMAVLAGALMFAVSDLAVARDRFVSPGPINRLWGWPLYFAAQLTLAWTVAAPA